MQIFVQGPLLKQSNCRLLVHVSDVLTEDQFIEHLHFDVISLE